MSYVKNWLHCVWGTKNRIPFLTREIKIKILDHIKANAKEKNIYIDILDGHAQHLHCLISLSADQTLSKVIQLLKGESSFWINKNRLTKYKFKWAVEYFAVSVSESQVTKVRKYILNQEEHHKKKTWDEEYNEFINEYGFEKFVG
jgi:putative transposase